MANYPNLYLDQPYVFQVAQQIWTVDRARLRAWPGLDQPVLALVREGTACKVCHTEPTFIDGLTWWPLRCSSHAQRGWMAEAAANGAPILSSVSVTQQQQVIHQEAERLDLSHTIALAVFAIESAPNDLPGPHLILNLETHILDDYLMSTDATQRNRFFHHFAYGSPPWTDQRWRSGSQWLILDTDQHNQRQAINFAATLFGREAALRATSMGPGQIMGFNHADMGYPDACTMFDTWRAEPLAAVRGFFRYLETSGLVEPLRQRQWTEFAMGYNGLGNHDYYADRLARAVAYMESTTASAPALARRTAG